MFFELILPIQLSIVDMKSFLKILFPNPMIGNCSKIFINRMKRKKYFSQTPLPPFLGFDIQIVLVLFIKLFKSQYLLGMINWCNWYFPKDIFPRATSQVETSQMRNL